MAPSARSSERGRKRNTRMDQNVGQASAVILPLIQWGVLGYVTWVVVYLICVKYLINPSTEYRQSLGIQPRRATGIAIIVVDVILILLVFVPWIRLLEIIWTKQDYLPVGDKSRSKAETSTSAFDKYDASICDYEGLPLWCNECHHFKPDRTHHCKELGKCVRRMDHFCPWAGGIVAESGHKHFVQFTFFGFLYTSFSWMFIAVFLADHNSQVGSVPGTWIGALAVGAFFSLFSGGIFFTTSYNLMINYTSVESIQRGGVQNIAFLVSRSSSQTPLPAPLPSNQKKSVNIESDVETLESSEKSAARDSIPSTAKTPVGQSDPSPVLPHAPKPSEHHGSDSDNWSVLGTVYRGSKRDRPFIVIQTKPFQHPWYIGLMMGWKDTMGTSIIDWFSPFKQSPCKVRTRRGEYRWGVVVFDMAREFEAQHPGVQLAILEGQR